MAHLLDHVTNEKEKRSNTYVNKLLPELVITIRSLVTILQRSYDEIRRFYDQTYDFSKSGPWPICMHKHATRFHQKHRQSRQFFHVSL